jgi:hypothetical protein
MPLNQVIRTESESESVQKSLQNIESLTDSFRKAISGEGQGFVVSHPFFDAWKVTLPGRPSAEITLGWTDLSEFNSGRRSVSEMTSLFLSEFMLLKS